MGAGGVSIQYLTGDCRAVLKTLDDGSAHCCVTSPPYFGLRSYLRDGHPEKEKEIGIEQTPDEYVARMVEVFREVRRVLRDDGTLWLNLGDSYVANKGMGNTGRHSSGDAWGGNGTDKRKASGLAAKQLIGIPWRVAFALQSDGWYLRQDIIWHKPNPMPESVRDRCTKAHEYIFMFSKRPKYYFDHAAMKEPAVSDHPSGNGFKRNARKSYQNADGTARGNDQQWQDVGGMRNRRSVWTVTTKPFKGAHFATFPPDLIEPCILAGCPQQGTVLDPFGGAGTTGLVADRLQRNAILIDLNDEYRPMAVSRLDADQPGPLFARGAA